MAHFSLDAKTMTHIHSQQRLMSKTLTKLSATHMTMRNLSKFIVGIVKRDNYRMS